MTDIGITIEEVVMGDRRGAMILARTPFHMKDVCKSIPGARWNPEAKAWIWSPNALAAQAVHQRLSMQLPRSRDFMELAQSAQREADKADAVKTATDLPPVPITRHPAWTHQLQAYHFANDKPAAMLAMGMGTGKSKVTTDLIQNAGDRRVLIVGPKRVVRVWPKEIAKHAADPSQYMVLALDGKAGSIARRLDMLQQGMRRAEALGLVFVPVINYEAVWREPMATALRKIKWDRIIADESHKIKAPNGAQSKYLGKLADSAHRRLALTGTPMPHNPLDVFGQYRFLDRSIYGDSFFRFKHQYAVWGGYGGHEMLGYRNEDELNRRFYSIAYRCTEDVLDLPEAMHIPLSTQLEPAAAKMYADLSKEFVAWVGEGVEVTATNVLVKLLRFQQITSGFLPTDTEGERVEHEVSTAKAELLEETLEDIALDEPVVVVCRFTHDLDVVRAIAEKQGRRYGELSGRRDDALNDRAEMADDIDIAGVQIQSGGVGIDLTRARYGFYYSPGVNRGDYEQSLRRIHRPGQTRPVTYYDLTCEGTIDEDIYRSFESGHDLVESVLASMKARVTA